MPRTIEQVISKQLTQVVQDPGIAGRMQAMAAIVHPNPVELETAGISTHRVSLLKDRHPVATCTCEFVGSTNPGRTCTQNYYVGGVRVGWGMISLMECTAG